jgi:hypothetical protein
VALTERYNQWYKVGNHDTLFYLADYTPDLEESRCLLLRVIYQAKRDIVNCADATSPAQREVWEEARAFIFDDDYTIDWGGRVATLEDLCGILGLDIWWLREKIKKEIHKETEKREKMCHGKKAKAETRSASTPKPTSGPIGRQAEPRGASKCRQRRDSEHRKTFRQGFGIKKK